MASDHNAANCASVDCRPAVAPAAPPPAPRQPQAIDYQAKDYDSFLRALLDLIPTRVPGWRDRTEADLGMALLELFAYIGDQLGYYQDRVAGEAYLRTALLHESVRRHLALVDCHLDPGAAATAYLVATVSRPKFVPAGFPVATLPGKISDPVVFEIANASVLAVERNSIVLAAAAPTNAARDQLTLQGDLGSLILPGARLGVESANSREWVSTVGLAQTNTVLHTTTITVSPPLQADYPMAGSIVRGNVLVATHGAAHLQTASGTARPGQSISLEFAPLTYVDDEQGVPVQSLEVRVHGIAWTRVEDFVGSGPTDAHYTLTQDNEGFVTVHFGNGSQGRSPEDGARIDLAYRSGIGDAGVVAAESLTEFTDPEDSILTLSNPEPSFGARNPASMDEARLLGPRNLRKQNRAVTAADYEQLAMEGVLADGAVVRPLHVKATFRYIGSWQAAVISVDFADRRPLSQTPGRRAALLDLLESRRLAGLDVKLEDARYAPLQVSLVVHVLPGYLARVVRDAVARALGRQGFFAPARFGFGDVVRLSELYALVQSIEGVEHVTVRRFKRLGERYPDNTTTGGIEVGPLEIPRCDDDPAAPENGVLFVRTCGGNEG